MIAKIVSHGADATKRGGRLICGLEQTAAFGVTTNQGFLISCLRHPGLPRAKRPRPSSASIATNCSRHVPTTTADAALAALLLYVTNPHAPPWRSGRSLAATFPLTMRLDLGHGVQEVDIVRGRDGGYVASSMAASFASRLTSLAPYVRFHTDGLMESVRFLRDGDRLYVLHRGVTIAVARPDTGSAGFRRGGRWDGKVRAAMNGRVVAVLVKAGEQVAAGQPVMTLEAMKMEHVHTAVSRARCRSIDVAEGEQVTTGRIVWRSRGLRSSVGWAKERQRRAHHLSPSML